MNPAALLSLIGLPIALSPLVYLEGRLEWRAARREHDAGHVSGARWLALALLALTWAAYGLAARDFAASGQQIVTVGAVALRLDGMSLLLSGLALGLGTAVVLFSGPYMAGEAGQEKYYTMLLVMIGAMIGLSCAADVFNLWVWFETMAVSSYLLVAFYKDRSASLEAGVKYLVQSAVGSGLVLLGVAVVLAGTGDLSLSGVRFADRGLAILAGALFTIGFGVKIAMIPMHTWLPDAHSQAPSGISAMLSGVVIEAGLIALLRTFGALAGANVSWGVVLMLFGAINMIGGNLLALRQTQVKRLLAYSSLAHMGYMLIGLGASLHSGDATAAQGSFFHMLNHGLMKGLAFLAVGALMYGLLIRRGRHDVLTAEHLNGAASRYPLLALCLSIALLGLGGLPPLAGFMSKWQIFVGGFGTGDAWIQALMVFAALNSVLSLAYYAPLVNAMYRHEPSPEVKDGAPLRWELLVPVVILAAAVIILGVAPSLAGGLSGDAASALMLGLGM
ncbi:MAG: NADH dehydrogenase [Anaerolineae bacterium]|nr:NADH dehydrogenase [Anaerolineae bacterium]